MWSRSTRGGLRRGARRCRNARSFVCHGNALTLLLINTKLAVDEIVAACDGDLRDALRALMLLNERLELRLEQMSEVHPRTSGCIDSPESIWASRPSPHGWLSAYN